MKRTYIIPAISVINVESTPLMAASVKFSADGGSGTAPLNEGNATGEALGKSTSFELWDDEE
ncbi:MAG: hypothetical protein ACI4TW_03515 [Prevotella sp.]